MPHKTNVQIYKIDGVGVNFERFYPCTSSDEKIALREKYGFSSDDFILIYTAEFIPRKNHKLLFDILPALKAKIPPLKVLLCGRGELLEQYKDFAAEKQMDYVTFTGYTKDVADYCRLSDLLVMPSFQEGLPMAMIEAIATGLPVVASDIRGHNDVIEDCANGFLFGTDDVSGFEKAILTLYKNPALRTEMGARNIERAKTFDVEKAVGAMDAIYHTVM
ncbi:MAG: glycosyltransferase family 4 protein [Spirochaetaceae bacterium]|nr:glycosyltransferase family 4 protein [Spirochaetaceae bacterium]